jgi:hypothetical protein
MGVHKRVIFLKEHTILIALAGNKNIFPGDEVLHINALPGNGSMKKG